MGELIDFERGRQRVAHERREAKAGKLREAFQAVREAWEDEVADRAARRRKWKEKIKKPKKDKPGK